GGDGGGGEERGDGEQREGARGHPDGADHGDHVRRDRRASKRLYHRGEQARETGAEEVQHDRSRSYWPANSARSACARRTAASPVRYLADSPRGSCGNAAVEVRLALRSYQQLIERKRSR